MVFTSNEISLFGIVGIEFLLTHYRPAMPFGNRKKYFIESFQFNIVTI